MPRTKISRDLGPLPRGPGLRVAHRNTDSLLQILRSLAIKNQREQPRVFYSLREVAKQFRVPVSSVAKIYRDLEHEGLLSRVRGSKTLLQGRRYDRQLSMRGFVGLPALFSNFVTIPEYRTFFTHIRHELWLRGFATTMVFFRPEEMADQKLTQQLKTYNVDTVIWYQMGRSPRESLMRLSDMGVRVVGISQIGIPTAPSRYYVWKQRAIEALLREWRDANSVRRITIADSRDYRSPVTEELVRLSVNTLGIESVTKTFAHDACHIFLRDLCRAKTDGIVFPTSVLASMFAFRSPDKLTNLLRGQRVAFIDGPIDIPFAKVPDVPVDLLTFDWQAIAETIVHDLITLEAFDQNRNTTFEAQVHSRVSLSRFCEPLCPVRT